MERVTLVETPIHFSDAVDFDAIVTGHGRLLFGIAYAVLRNSEDAEDVVQETFIKAFRSHDIGKVERMQAWLGHIAWRLAVNRRKKRSRNEQELALEELVRTLPIQEVGAEALLLKKEREVLLERLLQSLPYELRETFILLAVDEITSPIAAEILGIAESSVRDRLSRARKLIKQKLSAVMEHDHGA
jgi:RNA polymerase sigma-70 factor (ECF subfamily)